MRNVWRASEGDKDVTSLVSDCPRCGVKNTTFDVKGFETLARVEYSWQHFAEVFSKCRHCARTATFLVSLSNDFENAPPGDIENSPSLG